jgi:hypothetical protein
MVRRRIRLCGGACTEVGRRGKSKIDRAFIGLRRQPESQKTRRFAEKKAIAKHNRSAMQGAVLDDERASKAAKMTIPTNEEVGEEREEAAATALTEGEGAGGGGPQRVNDDDALFTFSLASSNLTTLPSPRDLMATVVASLGSPGWEQLYRLDLSRNKLTELPSAALQALPTLQVLDVSRNQLRELPPALGTLKHLRELHAVSNSLRPAARSLPTDALVSLRETLTLLDLRYNQKIKPGQAAVEALIHAMGPRCEVELALPGCRIWLYTDHTGCHQLVFWLALPGARLVIHGPYRLSTAGARAVHSPGVRWLTWTIPGVIN